MAPYRDLMRSREDQKYYKSRLFKKHNCPVCEKELIRLEPYEDTSCYVWFEYWCDNCNIDISIRAPKKLFNSLKEKEND